jgi:hypothetical protein
MTVQTAPQSGNPMSDPVEDLLLDLIGWIAEAPRPYGDVMDAWRTSCPRLPIWEEAVDRGYVRRVATANGATIHATTAGTRYLSRHGRSVAVG